MWPALTAALDELRRGDGRVLLSLADLYDERGSDGHYENTQEAFTAILCQDQERTTDRAVAADTNRRANAAAPFADPGLGAGRRAGRLRVLARAAHQPRAHAAGRGPRADAGGVDHRRPGHALPGRGRPRPPARRAAATFEGTQHTAALHGDRCIDDAVTAYLVDGTLPAEGARCPAL